MSVKLKRGQVETSGRPRNFGSGGTRNKKKKKKDSLTPVKKEELLKYQKSYRSY